MVHFLRFFPVPVIMVSVAFGLGSLLHWMYVTGMSELQHIVLGVIAVAD